MLEIDSKNRENFILNHVVKYTNINMRTMDDFPWGFAELVLKLNSLGLESFEN